MSEEVVVVVAAEPPAVVVVVPRGIRSLCVDSWLGFGRRTIGLRVIGEEMTVMARFPVDFFGVV